MDEDVKNSLALDVLVNNEKVNVIQLSGKLNLPLPACSQHLEGWLNACPEKEKISREYLVREKDKDGNIFFRFVSGEGKNFKKEGSTSFLFSLEKNHVGGLSSSIYHGGNSSYKRIKLTPELRKGKVPLVVTEAVKEPPKETVVKKEEPKVTRENIVSKFFSEKPKEKPKEPPKEEVKEPKSDSGSDKDNKDSKVAPPKKPPVKVDKKPDGKFKGKTAPVGSRSITSFFTKVPKSAPAAPPKTTEAPQKEKEEPEKPVEVAKKRPLGDKSPVQERKSPPKRKKLSKKPKIKAGTSRILQIVDEDSSDSEEEKIDREEVEEKQENKDVMLENEEVQQKTPPKPKKKKKIITECFKDEDGYDNVTFKEVDCSSSEE